MARNKFDVDERLETPFDFRHLKRVGVYIGKHKWKMLLALLLSALASVTSLAVPKITQTVMDVAVPQKNVDLLLKMALALMGIIVVGIVYICEAASVILQVGYFKLTHGKRLFKMAPIHHHFEKCGWSEIKIVGVFSLITLIAGAISLLGL